jgi:TRAP-type C4-dicarboxylate transport system permease small subunit
MPGLVPGIHVFAHSTQRGVDGRDEPAMTKGMGRRSPSSMAIADKLVLQRQRHLKWRALDRLELVLMVLCGVLCFGFSMSVTADIVTRTIGHPWLWLQEVTSTLFIYAIFVGAAVATRRNDHLYLTAISESMHGVPRLIVEIILRIVVLAVAACLIWYGYQNYLRGFGSFRLPSGTPIASLYAVIPVSGVLIALFTIEQLVNGIVNGFDHPEPRDEEEADIPQVDTNVEGRPRL